MITLEQMPMVAISSMNDTHLEETLLINRLEVAARADKIEEVSQVLNELQEHTIIHFKTEEEMMEKTRFPAYSVHKAEHDRHLHELSSLIKYFDTNRDTKAIIAYLDGNLVKWLLHHIETMDTITAQFLKEHLASA